VLVVERLMNVIQAKEATEWLPGYTSRQLSE